MRSENNKLSRISSDVDHRIEAGCSNLVSNVQGRWEFMREIRDELQTRQCRNLVRYDARYINNALPFD